VGTGFSDRVLREISGKLKPLAVAKTPLARIPESTNRYGFGKPFRWSAAHWIKPKLVAEVTYLTWTADGFLRHVSFEGLRSDKPAREVVRRGPG
jgi:bifunctional non-homologous end joining protein LigD